MGNYNNLILALRCCSASADTIENLLTQNRAQQDIIEKQAAVNKRMADRILEMDKQIGALEEALRDEKHRFDRLSDFEVAESQQLAEARAALRNLHESDPDTFMA